MNVNVSVNIVNVAAVQVMYVVIFLLYNRSRLGSQPSRTIGGMPTVWRAAGFMVLRWIPMDCIPGTLDRVKAVEHSAYCSLIGRLPPRMAAGILMAGILMAAILGLN